MIIIPLLIPDNSGSTKNKGRLEIALFTYLSILLSAYFPIEFTAIAKKSAAFATYYPWKFPAETSISLSNPSDFENTRGLSVAPLIY